jgi:hypothetical protein
LKAIDRGNHVGGRSGRAFLIAFFFFDNPTLYLPWYRYVDT